MPVHSYVSHYGSYYVFMYIAIVFMYVYVHMLPCNLISLCDCNKPHWTQNIYQRVILRSIVKAMMLLSFGFPSIDH